MLVDQEGPAGKTTPMGEGEIKPKGAAGAGARRYAAMKEVPRVSVSEGDDGVSRRSRPVDRT
jgi:hypothetical protein